MGFFTKLWSPREEKEELTEDSFISLKEFEEEMNTKNDFEKMDEMLEKLKKFLIMEVKILKYIKIGDYLIDALVFTKKGIFLLDLQSLESGCLSGKLENTYLKIYPQKAAVKNASVGYAKIPKKNLKNFESTEILNPLGQLVVWKEAIKRQKRLSKFKFYTVVVTQNDFLLEEKFFCSPYFFSIYHLGRFINNSKNIYTKEQVDEAYNAFATFEN